MGEPPAHPEDDPVRIALNALMNRDNGAVLDAIVEQIENPDAPRPVRLIQDWNPNDEQPGVGLPPFLPPAADDAPQPILFAPPAAAHAPIDVDEGHENFMNQLSPEHLRQYIGNLERHLHANERMNLGNDATRTEVRRAIQYGRGILNNERQDGPRERPPAPPEEMNNAPTDSVRFERFITDLSNEGWQRWNQQTADSIARARRMGYHNVADRYNQRLQAAGDIRLGQMMLDERRRQDAPAPANINDVNHIRVVGERPPGRARDRGDEIRINIDARRSDNLAARLESQMNARNNQISNGRRLALAALSGPPPLPPLPYRGRRRQLAIEGPVEQQGRDQIRIVERPAGVPAARPLGDEEIIRIPIGPLPAPPRAPLDPAPDAAAGGLPPFLGGPPPPPPPPRGASLAASGEPERVRRMTLRGLRDARRAAGVEAPAGVEAQVVNEPIINPEAVARARDAGLSPVAIAAALAPLGANAPPAVIPASFSAGAALPPPPPPPPENPIVSNLPGPSSPAPMAAGISTQTQMTVSAPNASAVVIPDILTSCDNSVSFKFANFSPFHKCALDVISQAMLALKKSDKNKICDRWKVITQKRGKNGVPKEPTLKQLNKLALFAQELEANHHRVNFGRAMRARKRERKDLVNKATGAYTVKQANNPNRVYIVQPGQSIHRKGWVQRTIGKVKRRVSRLALVGQGMATAKQRAKWGIGPAPPPRVQSLQNGGNNGEEMNEE